MTGDPIEAAVEAAILRVVDRLYDVAGPRAYSVKEVAARLGVSSRTVYRLIERGHLAIVPHVAPPRIAAVELDRFIAAGRVAS